LFGHKALSDMLSCSDMRLSLLRPKGTRCFLAQADYSRWQTRVEMQSRTHMKCKG
jgi:hypothetical protein